MVLKEQITTIRQENPVYPADALTAVLDKDAPAEFLAAGPIELLTRPKIGFFCSSQCPGSIVLKTFDAIIDLAGTITYKAARPILKKNGSYINTSPGPKEMIGSLFSGGRYKLLLLKPSAASLEKLAVAGLQVFISKRYDFPDYKKAYDEVKKGGMPGKAVFIVN